ncbi:hypothetical protein P280DRAFT_78409 [Massarina eburnea CBS 473.64]|uniref:Cryptic loci regulator 2 N-terminal domain-containing protein n=1 Tax=Massarina eburnea CBS 473.64 TaxID=1395130 RepID=A0A6A6RSX1_9PLEO|nr:hypothetical protein P280DRAFT_78409 [Massarina eburnea CBS 473.64]
MVRKIVVPLRAASDGDPTHRPVGTGYTEVDPPTLYLEKIATEWMRARGEAAPGISYTLERLPDGYAMFQKPRIKDPQHLDKWLYGNPKHKTFDSPNRFYPHFEWMMNNGGNTIDCPCSMCIKGGVLHSSSSHSNSNSNVGARSSVNGSIKSSPPQPAPTRPVASSSAPVPAPQVFKGRPKMVLTGMDASRVDEEGTPDVYRNLIDKLKRHGKLDEAIMEPMSMDWRAEQAILPQLLTKRKEEAQWIPRVGDIVLYIRNIPDGLEFLQSEETGEHQFYDPVNMTFKGAPVWEAGLVGQVPEEPVETNDAIHEGEKEYNVSWSGLRVEPLPNPNDKNKSLSKRYQYVPVSYTRPFFLWRDLLSHDDEDWHPTIKNALTAMSVLSLMGMYRFRGKWPEASIYAHGLYVGSEFLGVGDTVRLMPKADNGEEECTDIMVIRSIQLMMKNLDQASGNDYDDGEPYSSHVWIFGQAYTTEASRSDKQWACDKNIDIPKVADGYGEWYPLHPATKELAVPFRRVLGRLYELDVMQMLLPSTHTSMLDHGHESILEARQFACENDNRIIASPGSSWWWAKSRAEALDLETINGLEVGKYDTDRDPSGWRKKIKLMEGVGKAKDTEGSAPVPDGGGGGSGNGFKNLRSFMAPSSIATPPVRSQGSRQGDSSRKSSMAGSTIGQKRGHAIDVSDDQEEEEEEEEEEEIRQQTRILDDFPTSSQSKKPRVVVRVD